MYKKRHLDGQPTDNKGGRFVLLLFVFDTNTKLTTQNCLELKECVGSLQQN